MKRNVDLTKNGYFSEGSMQGGFRVKGVFRERKPMKNSKLFKKILKMGMEEKKHHASRIAQKLFGIKMPPMVWNGDSITVEDAQVMTLQANGWATTGTATTNSTWVSNGATF